MKFHNKGFDTEEIEELRLKLRERGKNYILDLEDKNTKEYCHFYFIGDYKGKEVIYDAVMYTLRLHHNSELYEIAEHRAAIKFPEFRSITYDEDENGDLKNLDDLEEKIGLYMAEVIMELEADEAVKVKEHVEIDKNIDFGIGLDIGLNVEKVNDRVISEFIEKFNQDRLKLDDTLYSFQEEDELIVK